MKMPRFIYVVVGTIIGVIASLSIQRALVANPDDGCEVSSSVLDSPSGIFRATLTTKVCAWGFGQAANFASVKLEKIGPNGWFKTVDLETDQPSSERPTIVWSSPNDLEVVIKSEHITGSIQTTEEGLHFVRKYAGKNEPNNVLHRTRKSGAPVS